MIPPGFISISKAYEDLRRRYNSEAFGQLQFPLCIGALQAFWFDPQGREHLLSSTTWQGMVESAYLDIFQAGTAIITADDTTSLRTVVVRESDVARLFSSRNNASTGDSLEAGTAGTKAKGGRKATHDLNAVWASIAWTLHDIGEQTTQEALIDKVQASYDASYGADSAPGRTYLQPMIRQLFEEKRNRDRSSEYKEFFEAETKPKKLPPR